VKSGYPLWKLTTGAIVCVVRPHVFRTLRLSAGRRPRPRSPLRTGRGGVEALRRRRPGGLTGQLGQLRALRTRGQLGWALWLRFVSREAWLY
jgi:hypothetical protein